MILRFWHQSVDDVKNRLFFHLQFTRNKLPSSKQICFVCNTSRKDDSKSHNFGGLGKCMEDEAAAKLQKCYYQNRIQKIRDLN